MAKPVKPATARGARTRQKLLDAAEAEFGERGFHHASISNITHTAGVAQGTFYIYFESKDAILQALVEHMGEEMRRNMGIVAEVSSNRIEAEREGLRRFLDYAVEHNNLYRIVMQSQFVDERLHRRYYDRLLANYERRLVDAQRRGEIREGDPGALATALVGIAYFMGLRYTDWEHRLPEGAALETVLDFITEGLSPDPSRRAPRPEAE